MAVTYDKVAYPKIEKELRNYLNNDFKNVYVSPIFRNAGNEFIRVNLLDSGAVQTHSGFEEREYRVSIRYYFNSDLSNPRVNESIKNKIDRLKKKLLDKQTNSDKWVDLDVETIEYGVEDDDNDNTNIYIAELVVLLRNYNQF